MAPAERVDENERQLIRLLAVTAGVSAAVTTVAVAGLVSLFRVQAARARAVIGKPFGEIAPHADRTYKPGLGTPIDLLLFGDSIAAGLGAERAKHTLGARLSKRLARECGRAVTLHTYARVGAETADALAQIKAVPPAQHGDVAVIIVGGNDVIHLCRPQHSVERLVTCVRLLHERGIPVVVGVCPDLSALRPVPQPLRRVIGSASRHLAYAQQEAVVAEGAYAVSLARVVGPFFIANPDEMFSLDQFHPSSTGYRRLAKALTPSVLATMGLLADLPFGHHVPVSEPAKESGDVGDSVRD